MASDLESHLSQCSPCHSTLLELGSEDTFNEIAFEAFERFAQPTALSMGAECDSDVDQTNMKLVAAAAKQWSSENPPRRQHEPSDSFGLSRSRTAEVEHVFDVDGSGNSIGLLGQFRIEQLLGCGSSGVVYLATDTVLDRKIALKVLRPSLGESARARFLAEARAAAAMDHPNVVSIHQVGVEKELAFIAMKWVPGETLAARLKSRRSISADEVRKIGSQIAAGLAAAHAANLIHRDIKPANIWIEEETGNVKILDFGLVRASDDDVSLTMTGMLAGTPSYMSPEQARGAKLDGRSDLFSLGCVLYQSLTGVLPFAGDNVLAMLQSVQKDAPQPPDELDQELPEELSSLVMCLLQKSPDSRPPTASAVSTALQCESSDWSFVPAVKPRSMKSRGNSWFIAAAAIVCAFGFASLFWPQIIRIATDQGELVIETNDSDVKIEVIDSGGKIRIVDLKTDQAFDIKSGEYELRPVSDENSISIDRRKIVMKRGGKEIVSVTKWDQEHAVSDLVQEVEAITKKVRKATDADEERGDETNSKTDLSRLQAEVFRERQAAERMLEDNPREALKRLSMLRTKIVSAPGVTKINRVLLKIIDRDIRDFEEYLSHNVDGDLGQEHVLEPGDIVGVFAPELFVVKSYNEESWTPMMVNANHEIVCTEFELRKLSGCKVADLTPRIREALKANPDRGGFPATASIRVKLLRKCPVPGELPNGEAQVIAFAPTHSQQVAESLRHQTLFRPRLLADFGAKHPSVVDSDSKTQKLKQFLSDVESAEDRIFADKQAQLLQHQAKPKEWRAAISEKMAKLNREIHEMTKARLVKDLNWILLSDRMPYGLDKEGRKRFVQDRIDTVRERASEKILEYSSKRASLIKAGWRSRDARPALLDHYSLKLLPSVLKNLEARTGRRLDKFQVNGGEVFDLRFYPIDEPMNKPYRKVRAGNRKPTGTNVQVKLVTGTSEQPITNATVRLYRIDFSESGDQLVSESNLGPDGIVKYQNLVLDQPEKHHYELLIKADGFGSQRFPLIRGLSAKDAEAGSRLDWKISMVKAQELSGVIVDHDGNPVVGALIYKLYDRNGNAIDGFTTARTDSEGRFSIRDLSPFTGRPQSIYQWLRVRHPDFGPQKVEVRTIPDEKEIVLDPPTHVRFQVVDGESQSPVPHYKIAAQLTDQSLIDKFHKRKGRSVKPEDWIVTTSDKNGWVQFTAPSTGSYNVSHLAGPGEEKYPRSIQLKAGIDGSVILEPMELVAAATVTGVVVDEDGSAVSDISVGWYGPDRPDTSAMIRSVKTNEGGAFKANLVPGENKLYIAVSGWRIKHAHVQDGETSKTYAEYGQHCKRGFIPIKESSSLRIKFVVEKTLEPSKGQAKPFTLRNSDWPNGAVALK